MRHDLSDARALRGTRLITARRRFAELYRKYGLWGLARRAVIKSGGWLRSVWRRLARNRNHVFVYEGPVGAAAMPEGLIVTRYTCLEEIPGQVLEGLIGFRGQHYPECVRQELTGNAVLWVGMINDEVVASQMTKLGHHIQKWFVPLDSRDLVIFGGSTEPTYFGRGIMPAMIQDHMANEIRGGGRAFADCKVWNKAAIRCIEKVGFRRLVTMKPLPRTRRPR